MNNFLLLVFVLAFPSTLTAQYVAQKPTQPFRLEKQSACENGGFWLKGHWEWNEAKQNYLWVKGHCEPYRKGYTYLPGKWVRRPEGWIWEAGVWKKV